MHGGCKGTNAVSIGLTQAASFNSETTRLLGLAYDRACQSAAADMTVREALARRIIEAAGRGERNVEKLIEHGLASS